ncbi:MAG: mitochondrial fission ELM1 family protein [Cohaesibacteraceae bacterium]|nr:mitochondrial fission ELM1 family protein [Cohaesibacteraceae bacterium]
MSQFRNNRNDLIQNKLNLHPNAQHIWLLTDGKAGDLNQCRGVAERLISLDNWNNHQIEERIVAPSIPWVWAMPRGPIPPRDRPGKRGSPLAAPFPGLVIASGRRTVPYLRYLKKTCGDDIATVFLKDPRTKKSGADLIWVPTHDSLRGEGILVSPTGPHRMSPETIANAKTHISSEIADLPGPRLSLVLGGDTKSHTFSRQSALRLAKNLKSILPEMGSVMVTTSRRTPEHLVREITQILKDKPGFIWTGEGDNPYIQMLAHADWIVVTADSHSMLSEALAINAQIRIFEPDDYPEKIRKCVQTLINNGNAGIFDGNHQTFAASPLDSTREIALEIHKRFMVSSSDGN